MRVQQYGQGSHAALCGEKQVRCTVKMVGIQLFSLFPEQQESMVVWQIPLAFPIERVWMKFHQSLYGTVYTLLNPYLRKVSRCQTTPGQILYSPG